MAARRTPGAPTPLGDLVAKTAPGRAAANVVVSRAVWEEVAGVAFARRTRPEKVLRGTLYVRVASAGWAQELSLHEPVLLERLHARGVPIQRLRFLVGEVEPAERGGVAAPAKEEIARARALPAPEPAKAALEKVVDPALRAAMEKAARAAARRDAEVEVKGRAESDRKPRIPGRNRH